MQFDQLKRREFITLLGGAAATWPVAARAQQPAMPVVGYLNAGAPHPDELNAFHKGLGELGYVEGRNVAVEYRWANNEFDRLPVLAAELVRGRVAVIVAPQIVAALAVKAATSTIPIVFLTGSDAVDLGLVTALSRPGGNITGINSLNIGVGLGAKRFGLLHELLPQAKRFALLVQPTVSTARSIEEARAAAAAIGTGLEVFSAGNNREIETAFAGLVQKRIEALMVNPAILFNDRRAQLATFAARYTVPAIFSDRRDAEAGGLMSYGPDWTDLNRQVGVYAGRILKGEKPGELPVQQPTKFELVINAQTARLIGIEVPPTLFARADEVIE
jgi:putative ABC transport system substrate-binding protein